MPMLRKVMASFVTAAALVSTALAGEFEDGIAAYASGNYRSAWQLLHPLADRGDALAQLALGLMLRFGQGVSQDYAEAARGYRSAADQDVAQAQNNLGWLHLRGQGVVKDTEAAVGWFRRSAAQGDAWGQFNLGYVYVHGEGVPQYPL